MWPCFQGLVDRQFRESQLILPPLSDFVNDNDSVSSVDSDPGGDRYSTMPERAYWPYHKRLHWAVHMVQRAYRGHQVRNAIRKLVSSIFVKKWDKKKRACALCSRACLLCYMCGYRVYQRIAARVHTGQFYFLDTRNGNIRWIKPHGARAESIALKVMCVECDLNPATKCCVECEDSYCDECYDGRHQKGARREHSYAPIVEATKICPYCKEAVQFRFCENCEQGHCVSCYEDRHKKGKKKRHKWRRMLKNIEWNFTDFPQPVDVCQYCGINMQNVTCDDCDDLYWYVPNVCCVLCVRVRAFTVVLLPCRTQLRLLVRTPRTREASVPRVACVPTADKVRGGGAHPVYVPHVEGTAPHVETPAQDVHPGVQRGARYVGVDPPPHGLRVLA